MAEPTVTQSRHPVRAQLRTVFAAALFLLPLIPTIAAASGLERYAWAGGVLGGAAAITRVLAIPEINAWLQRWFPPLAAAPKAPDAVAALHAKPGVR